MDRMQKNPEFVRGMVTSVRCCQQTKKKRLGNIPSGLVSNTLLEILTRAVSVKFKPQWAME